MVVPPAQAEEMVAALPRTGIPHAYLRSRARVTASAARGHPPFAGGELSFYGQVFGFEPADAIEPVELGGARVPAGA